MQTKNYLVYVYLRQVRMVPEVCSIIETADKEGKIVDPPDETKAISPLHVFILP